MCLVRLAQSFPSKPQVQCELARHLPVVLKVKRGVAGAKVKRVKTRLSCSRRHPAQEKILESRQGRVSREILAGGGVAERYDAPASIMVKSVQLVFVVFAAEPE